MVEKINRNQERIILEQPGRFGYDTRKEHLKKLRIDRLIYKESNAKNFRNFLVTSIKMTVAQKNKELEQVLIYLLSKYDEYEGRT